MLGTASDIFEDEARLTRRMVFCDHDAESFADPSQKPESVLQTLDYKKTAHPHCLSAHINKIFFCYHHVSDDALYQALYDLLVVLAGRGDDLVRRLLTGCRNRLEQNQTQYLWTFFQRCKSAANVSSQPLTELGIIGSMNFIELINQPEQSAHDPLQLANDCIEFSQLDQAMTVLEAALEVNPERQDLQTLLAELYQRTDNRERYLNFNQMLTRRHIKPGAAWRALANIFARPES